jgi:CheY-like chemotaxis protein
MKKKAILCVDDEAVILLSIRLELKDHFRERYIYETAANADDAFHIIDELDSEGVQLVLIISDWHMPGLKGDDFLLKIKQKHNDVKTILLTGYAMQDIVDKIEEGNIADAVLIKPWSNNELILIAEKLLKQNISDDK